MRKILKSLLAILLVFTALNPAVAHAESPAITSASASFSDGETTHEYSQPREDIEIRASLDGLYSTVMYWIDATVYDGTTEIKTQRYMISEGDEFVPVNGHNEFVLPMSFEVENENTSYNIILELYEVTGVTMAMGGIGIEYTGNKLQTYTNISSMLLSILKYVEPPVINAGLSGVATFSDGTRVHNYSGNEEEVIVNATISNLKIDENYWVSASLYDGSQFIGSDDFLFGQHVGQILTENDKDELTAQMTLKFTPENLDKDYSVVLSLNRITAMSSYSTDGGATGMSYTGDPIAAYVDTANLTLSIKKVEDTPEPPAKEITINALAEFNDGQKQHEFSDSEEGVVVTAILNGLDTTADYWIDAMLYDGDKKITSGDSQFGAHLENKFSEGDDEEFTTQINLSFIPENKDKDYEVKLRLYMVTGAMSAIGPDIEPQLSLQGDLIKEYANPDTMTVSIKEKIEEVKTDITIVHADNDNGKLLESQTVENVTVGQPYTIESKEFADYRFIPGLNNLNVTVEYENQIFYVFYSKLYGETYSFKAKGTNEKLPEEVMAQLPTRKGKYLNDEKVTPETKMFDDVVLQKSCPGGHSTYKLTWSFLGWDENEITIKGKDAEFVGLWGLSATGCLIEPVSAAMASLDVEWNDENDNKLEWPEDVDSLSFVISYGDDENRKESTLTLTKDNPSIESDLFTYVNDGYFVIEDYDYVDGYYFSYTGDDENNLHVVYTKAEQMPVYNIDLVTVVKYWDDNNNSAGKRPEKLQLIVKDQDGVAYSQDGIGLLTSKNALNYEDMLKAAKAAYEENKATMSDEEKTQAMQFIESLESNVKDIKEKYGTTDAWIGMWFISYEGDSKTFTVEEPDMKNYSLVKSKVEGEKGTMTYTFLNRYNKPSSSGSSGSASSSGSSSSSTANTVRAMVRTGAGRNVLVSSGILAAAILILISKSKKH